MRVKHDLHVSKVRCYLEPGPIVLVSSAHEGERNVMTLGWHMILNSTPSLVGCFIWDQNHSRELIRKSKQCVINLPTFDLIDAVIGVGNTHGGRVDKFAKFGLTPVPATKVDVPLIDECHAHFECKLVDSSLIRRYSLFVFQVVKAHVAKQPRWPKTVHYRGGGVFMISGTNRSYRDRFLARNL